MNTDVCVWYCARANFVTLNACGYGKMSLDLGFIFIIYSLPQWVVFRLQHPVGKFAVHLCRARLMMCVQCQCIEPGEGEHVGRGGNGGAGCIGFSGSCRCVCEGSTAVMRIVLVNNLS